MAEKTPVADLPVHVWAPMSPGQPFFAFIPPLPIRFSGASALKAKRAAEEWRVEEIARLEAIEAAKAKRIAAASARRAKADADA